MRFQEEQHFRQPWVLLIVFGIAVLLWYAIIRQIIFGEPFGDEPAPDELLVILWILFGLALPMFMWQTKLITTVTDSEVVVHLRWLRKRTIPLEDIQTAQARTYNPILEYGGWGWRVIFGRGTAFNVSGNRGVQLTLKDGKHVLIGSQRPHDLEAAVQAQLPQNEK